MISRHILITPAVSYLACDTVQFGADEPSLFTFFIAAFESKSVHVTLVDAYGNYLCCRSRWYRLY